MTEITPRLALPLLQAGQAQKELFHNEALALLDLIVAGGVEEVGRDGPPGEPAPGQCWIVGTAPSGDWSGHDKQLAGWTDGGWRFLEPIPGMRVWSAADQLFARFDGEAWLVGQESVARLLIDGLPVVGSRVAAIVDPAGGALIDVEARAVIVAILTALRDHGLIAS